jgi:thymidylate synthase (FAD)
MTPTHSVTYIHSTDKAEELVAYMARVSNPKASVGDPSDKLIKYLITHKHWSPFEMVNLCVEINTTRSVAQQIIRHRSFSFQEFSQRYAEVTADPIIPQLRRQDTKNRQNSIDDLDDYTQQELQLKAKYVFEQAQMLYDEMIGAGVAKECARDVLPLATPTKLYMNGTLRSWMHYCDLRCGNGTQYEHKIIADQVKSLIFTHFPVIYNAMWS